MERLTLQFPGLGRKELEAFDKYITDNEYYRKKSKALYREWLREKTQMKQFAEEQMLNQIETITQELEKEIARLKTVIKINFWANR
jgi:hypothetical protein